MEKNIDMDLFGLDVTVNKLSLLLADLKAYLGESDALFAYDVCVIVFRDQTLTRINILNDYATTLGNDIAQMRQQLLADGSN